MVKVDYKKEYKQLYSGKVGKNVTVEVPAMNYLMIDGIGNPNTSDDFSKAIETLYAISYKAKFISKKMDIDYVVMPLEGLWYMDDMNEFTVENKDKWKWTLMIMQPSHITKEIINEAVLEASKKKDILKDKVRFESYNEGLCSQVLYVGPYTEEHESIMNLHEFIKDEGYNLRGYHHEIYLSDARRVAPEKLKTIIRQPMK